MSVLENFVANLLTLSDRKVDLVFRHLFAPPSLIGVPPNDRHGSFSPLAFLGCFFLGVCTHLDMPRGFG